jgi:hypothetical protein
MTPAQRYRVSAAELAAKAKAENNPSIRMLLDYLTRAYRCLAEHADCNVQTDMAPYSDQHAKSKF